MLGWTFVAMLVAVTGLGLHRAMAPRRVFYRRALRPYLIGFCALYGLLVLLLLAAFTFVAAQIESR